jgi:hypothetical protein
LLVVPWVNATLEQLIRTALLFTFTGVDRAKPTFTLTSWAVRWLLVCWLISSGSFNPSAQPKYEAYRVEKIPCTVHVIKVPRNDRKWELRSVHAFGKAAGLADVTSQLKLLSGPEINAVAGVNGDFYTRRGPWAGDPRGLQIIGGELVSAPAGGVSFWIDAADQPHIGETVSNLRVIWSDTSSAPIELNATRDNRNIVLYTPAFGPSTQTANGTELLLEKEGAAPWLPLRPGRIYQVKVREVRKANSPIAPDSVVLSVGPGVRAPRLLAGAQLRLSMETQPSLRGVGEAISGGPILVKDGKRQSIKVPESDSYIFSSMGERHPRSALGWNDQFYFLVSVDGRQGRTSVGMTLDELARELVKLGCQQAINLDGGGSATLWFEGKARNFLCDGFERPVANALAVVEKKNAK